MELAISRLKKKEPPPISLGYDAHKGLYCLAFVFSNALLAYGGLSLETNLWIGLFGFVLPFSFALWTADQGKAGKAFPGTVLSARVPRAVWFFLFLLAAAPRLAQTQVPGYWPVNDDGRFAYYSAELSRHWSWNIFFSPTQHPPAFNWLLALFFKAVPPSLFSLWLFPAICSFLVFVLGCVAARFFFPGLFSFLFGCLLAFSFWPLYTGKYCMYMVLFLLWEFAVFAAMGWFWKGGPREKTGRAAWLGILTAAGFWVAIAWPVVALAVTVTVYGMSRGGKQGTGRFFYYFLAPVLASGALFAILSWAGNNGAHIQSLWALGGPVDWLGQFMDSFTNLTALVWGCDRPNSYGPVWGGVLNPVLGAFFIVGLLECFLWRRHGIVRWALWFFLFMLLPGFITRNYDIFRNTQALPFLLLITLFGLNAVLSRAGKKNWVWSLCLVLAISTALDLAHLWRTYHLPLRATVDPASETDSRKVFETLRNKFLKDGEGVLLFDLKPNVADQTLSIATYSFNAARNPSLALENVHWMALLVDSNYEPFLKGRFQGGEYIRFYPKGFAPTPSQDTLMLAFLPIGPGDGDLLRRWMETDRAYRKVVWAAANIPENRDRSEVFEKLAEVYPFFKGDRFLESIYWSMAYDFNRWETLYGDKNYPLRYSKSREAIWNALQKGYPTAYFLNEWGGFLTLEKDYRGARRAFTRALREPVDNTPAVENLRALDRLAPADARDSQGAQRP